MRVPLINLLIISLRQLRHDACMMDDGEVMVGWTYIVATSLARSNFHINDLQYMSVCKNLSCCDVHTPE